MLVALSPGPFHVDAAAFAQGSQVEFYYTAQRRFLVQDVPPQKESLADKSWSFPNRVQSICFSPTGRKLALGIFEAECFVVVSLEDDAMLEFTEPLAGAGMKRCAWIFNDWIVTYAGFGLHLSLWSPTPNESQPDQISKPKLKADLVDEFVVAFHTDSSSGGGDFIALAHGEDELSVFACLKRGQRWKFKSKWHVKNVEALEFIDSSKLIVQTDPLANGELTIRRCSDGEVLTSLSTGISAFARDLVHSQIACWGYFLVSRCTMKQSLVNLHANMRNEAPLSETRRGELMDRT